VTADDAGEAREIDAAEDFGRVVEAYLDWWRRREAGGGTKPPRPLGAAANMRERKISNHFILFRFFGRAGDDVQIDNRSRNRRC
jgi:hypothetical protein